MGAKTLELLSTAWAPATAVSYARCMKPSFCFCEEERRPANGCRPRDYGTVRHVVGQPGDDQGLQPYLSAVNNFFKDHGREPMALGDLGATTTAYVIGVTMRKIKYFGDWAMESSVVLDDINPTVLTCPATWQLFGWMTPWGGQSARLPRQVAT
eukprot:jgi/Tetstr1/434107/TSEL_023251.t1